MLSQSLQRKIIASLEAHALGETEIRRIEGFGRNFLCRASAPLPENYQELLSFELNGECFQIVTWFGPTSSHR
jgi:hypothetical protein